jgi:hypothetical protein
MHYCGERHASAGHLWPGARVQIAALGQQVLDCEDAEGDQEHAPPGRPYAPSLVQADQPLGQGHPPQTTASRPPLAERYTCV